MSIKIKDARISRFCKEHNVVVLSKLSVTGFEFALATPNASFLICMDCHLILLLYDPYSCSWRVLLRNPRNTMTDMRTSDKLTIFGRCFKKIINFYIKNTYKSARRKGKYEYPLFQINRKSQKIVSKRMLLHFSDVVKRVYRISKLTIE